METGLSALVRLPGTRRSGLEEGADDARRRSCSPRPSRSSIKALQDAQRLDSQILTEQFYFWTVVAHVADPRGLHGLRGGGCATQEHHVDGDEEHPHHRRRHADVLLLRLVHLRLHAGGVAEVRPRNARRVPRLLRPHGAVERGWGRTSRITSASSSSSRSFSSRGRPASIMSGARHRADPPLGVPAPDGGARLRRLDPRRRLGLELRRLADDALRVPRRDRLRRRPRRRGRVHARRPAQPRPADRQVRRRRRRADRSEPTTRT